MIKQEIEWAIHILVHITHIWNKALETCKETSLICRDISKAFDQFGTKIFLPNYLHLASPRASASDLRAFSQTAILKSRLMEYHPRPSILMLEFLRVRSFCLHIGKTCKLCFLFRSKRFFTPFNFLPYKRLKFAPVSNIARICGKEPPSIHLILWM